MKDNLDNVVNFKCRTCLKAPLTNNENKSLELNNLDYEAVDQFCYLNETLSPDGGASVSLVRSDWTKFRELLLLQTSRFFSHKMKGKLYNLR